MQHERQKADQGVGVDARRAPMEDRGHLDVALEPPESPFDVDQCLIAADHRSGRQVGDGQVRDQPKPTPNPSLALTHSAWERQNTDARRLARAGVWFGWQAAGAVSASLAASNHLALRCRCTAADVQAIRLVAHWPD